MEKENRQEKPETVSEVPEELISGMGSDRFRLKYSLALYQVQKKIEKLDVRIEYVYSRIKSAWSTAGKLRRKSRAVNLETAEDTLNDLAGICIVCCYKDQVYQAASQLAEMDGMILVKQKDFIKKPKASGYRSLHQIYRLENGVRVEVQIRTVSMDAWARLDHELRYKRNLPEVKKAGIRLKEYADMMAKTEKYLSNIHRKAEEKMDIKTDTP